jgi:hypothetical protein
MNFFKEGKTNWKYIIIVLTLAIIVGAGALWYANRLETSYQPPERKNVVITLERTACYGICPDYKITIYGDGKVEYKGNMFVKVKGQQTSKISLDKVKELIDEFYKINYFSLKDRYYDPVTDLPTTITSISINGKSKRVEDYCCDAPKELRELEDKIDEITESEKWVKGGTEIILNGTADWETYRNEDFDLSIKYPPVEDTKITENIAKAGRFINKVYTTEIIARMSSKITTPPYRTFTVEGGGFRIVLGVVDRNLYPCIYTDEYTKLVSDIEKLTIQSVEFEKAKTVSEGQDGYSVQFCGIKDGIEYYVNIFDYNSFNNQPSPLIDQMLSTFRFLE